MKQNNRQHDYLDEESPGVLANAQLFEGPEAVGMEISQGNEGSDERHESSNPFPLYDIRDKYAFCFVCLCTTAPVIRIFFIMYFWWKYSLGLDRFVMLLMSVVDMLLVGSLNAWSFFVTYKVDLSRVRMIFDSWLIMSAAAAYGLGALLLLLSICGGNILAYPRYMLILQLVVHTIVLTCLFLLNRRI
mmetsp:Transcript_25074/g.38779  ORF Transcript_25074/g.38779 Transcript_25074/m.38779 type:complete len:188 (+) Transcript_25074:50-613(+)